MVNMNTRRHKHDWEVFDSWRYGENASYKQIRDRALEKYGFAPCKGTLSNRYGEGVKERAAIRKQRYKDDPKLSLFYKFAKRLDRFKHRKARQPNNIIRVRIDEDSPTHYKFRKKLINFKRKGESGLTNVDYTTKEAIDYFWPDGLSKCGHKFPFIECYLTGRVIDVTATTTHLDHIDNQAGNGLDNLGFTCAEANQAKHALSIPEMLSLFKEIINHQEKGENVKNV